MEIVVFNVKGGAGKTMLTRELSLYFDTLIMDLDPYGYGLTEEIFGSDRVVTLGLEDDIPTVEEGDVVYDFGGFHDSRLSTASSNADLIIIPLIPTIVNMKGAIESYNIVREFEKPILFVINSVYNDSDRDQALEFIQENIKEDIDYFTIPNTRALQTAENEGMSIIEFANTNNFKKHTYKKITTVMLSFMEKIKEYIE
jgi:chromosome partitioning protein